MNVGILVSYVVETVFASIFSVTIWFRRIESDYDYNGNNNKGNKNAMLRE